MNKQGNILYWVLGLTIGFIFFVFLLQGYANNEDKAGDAKTEITQYDYISTQEALDAKISIC